MKKQISILAVAAIAMIFTGCNKDNGENDVQTPISFTSGISTLTRAHAGLNTQFPTGRSVAFYVDNAGTSTQLYGNNVLTTNGTGGFTGGTDMFFPQTDDQISIYALHTNGTLAAAFPTAAITHTVAPNQTAAADYYGSDLLYATRAGVAKTTSAVQLNFYHMLSQVRVAVVSGANSPDLTGAKVQVLGTKLSANFTPSKTADMAVQANRAAMVAATGTAADITLSNEASTDFTETNAKYNDAVVVPQTVASGITFIRVELTDGLVMTYELPAELALASGKKYTYHVTVNAPTGLIVTSTVTDWDDAGTTTGDAN